VEAAAQGMERISGVNQVSTELMQSNKRVIETFDVQLKEFMEYQKLSAQTMEQVRALLSEISVAKDTQDVYLTGGGASGNAIGKKELEKLQSMLESQNERQQELLEDMAKNIRELSKSAQKGKFSLFK
jgi:hypothetical protein